jgi:hypothetical protein
MKRNSTKIHRDDRKHGIDEEIGKKGGGGKRQGGGQLRRREMERESRVGRYAIVTGHG